MNKQNDPHPTDKTPTGSPNRTGAIRHIVNAMQCWVEFADHSPFDYSLDRIGQLEGRVLELERELNATVKMPPVSL